MKKIIFISIALSLVLGLVSCSQKVSYKTTPFVCFGSQVVEVAENVGTIKIPVLAYPYEKGDITLPRTYGAYTTVTFEVVGLGDAPAKAGEHFELVSPKNGVITFSNSNEAEIEIKIVDKTGEFTGNTKLAIVMKSASDGYALGGASNVSVTIKDNDHPLAAILGTYVAKGVTDAWGDVYDITSVVEPVDGDYHKVTISGLLPYIKKNNYDHKAECIVSDDMTTLTIPSYFVYANVAYFVPMTTKWFEEAETLVFKVDLENHTFTNTGRYGGWTGEQPFDSASTWLDLIPEGVVWVRQ